MTSYRILADGALHNSPITTKGRVLRWDDILSCTEPSTEFTGSAAVLAMYFSATGLQLRVLPGPS